MISFESNRELLLGFIDESLDALSAVDSLLIALESNANDIDTVNAVFRPIHSLKGNAAYFGLMKVKKLSHTMENLLDRVRQGIHRADSLSVGLLLRGVDLLRSMLTSVREGRQELTEEETFQGITHSIERILSSRAGHADSASSLLDYVAELRAQVKPDGIALLEQLTSRLETLLSGGNDSERNPAALVTTGQSSAVLAPLVAEIRALLEAHAPIPKGSPLVEQLTQLLQRLRSEGEASQMAEAIADAIDIFETFTRADTGLDSLAVSMIVEKLEEIALSTPGAIHSARGALSSEVPREKLGPKVHGDKSMRIPEQALDDFLRCVGELLGVEEMFKYLMQQLQTGVASESLLSTLKQAVAQFECISKELRNRIMEVRKVEARTFLQKVPRIVRDIAQQSGKKIAVSVSGEGIRIDKSYIDLLDAPLTHMVRNAADHGIELPTTRVGNGKTEEGSIAVTLEESAEHLLLCVRDDGAGLNYDGIKKKAVALGLISDHDQLTKEEITDLLFHSGVSTAEEVTDVSGRGVGMDVVKRAIVEAGGRIEVSASPGKGTAFSISVPRNASTQIVDGYVVTSFADGMYVLPLGCVAEAFPIVLQDVSGIAGKGKVFNRRGLVFPVHSLDTLLGSRKSDSSWTDRQTMGVLVDIKGKRTVIAVKDIIGIQKVVCKQIEGDLLTGGLFDGAAISGTGKVSMIVNLEKLLQEMN